MEKREFSEEQVKDIIEMYAQRNSIVNIRKKYRCRCTFISKILKNNNIVVKSKRDLSGKNNNFYGKKHSEETKKKISIWSKKTFVERFGKERAKEIGTKLSNSKKGWHNPNKGKTYEEIHGDKRAKELRKLRSESLSGENSPNYGKNRSEESKAKQSKSMKIKWQNQEYREKSIKATLQARYQRPTSYEKSISSLCIEYNLPFVYCGDGTFLIGRKNPDFVNEKRKIAIEVFCDFYKKITFGSVEKYMEEREKYFKKYGYKIIFIRENDMKDKDWDKVCLDKINEGLK